MLTLHRLQFSVALSLVAACNVALPTPGTVPSEDAGADGGVANGAGPAPSESDGAVSLDGSSGSTNDAGSDVAAGSDGPTTPTPTPPTPLPAGATPPPPGGTVLGNLAAQMQHGEWRELTTTGFKDILLPNHAGNGDSPFIEFTDEAQRNPLTRKVYILGCARGDATGPSGFAYVCGSTDAEDAGFIEYDEDTNSWKRMPAAPVSSAPHAYDHAAMNPANGDYFYIESRQLSNHSLWKYSLGQWQELAYPSSAFSGFGALEFFPEMNSLVFVDGGDGWPAKLFTLPAGGSAWTSVTLNQPIGKYSSFSEYSAKHKLLFFGGGTGGDRVLLKMNAQGQVTRVADAPIPIGQFGFGGRQTIDPATGNLLAFETGSGGAGTGHVYEYDPIANQWTQRGTHLLGNVYNGIIAVLVPVPEHGVILAVNFNYGSDKVYLYKH